MCEGAETAADPVVCADRQPVDFRLADQERYTVEWKPRSPVFDAYAHVDVMFKPSINSSHGGLDARIIVLYLFLPWNGSIDNNDNAD